MSTIRARNQENFHQKEFWHEFEGGPLLGTTTHFMDEQHLSELLDNYIMKVTAAAASRVIFIGPGGTTTQPLLPTMAVPPEVTVPPPPKVAVPLSTAPVVKDVGTGRTMTQPSLPEVKDTHVNGMQLTDDCSAYNTRTKEIGDRLDHLDCSTSDSSHL